MSAGDRDTLAALRRLMHEHRWVSGRDSTDSYCICGWRQSPLDTRYPNHLADVLLASDWLAGVKAGALYDAADAIQALHPGEVKNSVLWLRERASFIDGTGHIDLDRTTEDTDAH